MKPVSYVVAIFVAATLQVEPQSHDGRKRISLKIRITVDPLPCKTALKNIALLSYISPSYHNPGPSSTASLRVHNAAEKDRGDISLILYAADGRLERFGHFLRGDMPVGLPRAGHTVGRADGLLGRRERGIRGS